MPRTTLLSLVLAAGAAADVTEGRTGIAFPEKRNGAALSKLGVRTKGPIKVYAVGEYDDGSFLLKMSYGVSAAKMAGALGDALKPRCSDAASIDEFEACLLKGLPDGAPKGTQMAFGTGGGRLSVTVNEKSVGTVGSKALASAFAGIYSDKNAVCAMNAVGADGEAAGGGGCGVVTAKRGALVGALLGYKLGSLFE